MAAGHISLLSAEPAVLEALQAGLQFPGFAIEAGSDPDLFLKNFSDVTSLVIIDLGSLGEQGVALCSALRTREGGRSVPILLLGSGRESVRSGDDAFAAGADAFFLRPVAIKIIRTKVQAYLGAEDTALIDAGLEVPAVLQAQTPASDATAAKPPKAKAESNNLQRIDAAIDEALQDALDALPSKVSAQGDTSQDAGQKSAGSQAPIERSENKEDVELSVESDALLRRLRKLRQASEVSRLLDQPSQEIEASVPDETTWPGAQATISAEVTVPDDESDFQTLLDDDEGTQPGVPFSASSGPSELTQQAAGDQLKQESEAAAKRAKDLEESLRGQAEQQAQALEDEIRKEAEAHAKALAEAARKRAQQRAKEIEAAALREAEERAQELQDQAIARAQERAESVEAEATKEAEARAKEIEEQALTKAKAQRERIESQSLSEAKALAEEIEKETKQQSNAEAVAIVEAAERRATKEQAQVEKKAQEEALAIVNEGQKKARANAERIKQEAQNKAQDILNQARQKASKQAQEIEQQAHQEAQSLSAQLNETLRKEAETKTQTAVEKRRQELANQSQKAHRDALKNLEEQLQREAEKQQQALAKKLEQAEHDARQALRQKLQEETEQAEQQRAQRLKKEEQRRRQETLAEVQQEETRLHQALAHKIDDLRASMLSKLRQDLQDQETAARMSINAEAQSQVEQERAALKVKLSNELEETRKQLITSAEERLKQQRAQLHREAEQQAQQLEQEGLRIAQAEITQMLAQTRRDVDARVRELHEKAKHQRQIEVDRIMAEARQSQHEEAQQITRQARAEAEAEAAEARAEARSQLDIELQEIKDQAQAQIETMQAEMQALRRQLRAEQEIAQAERERQEQALEDLRQQNAQRQEILAALKREAKGLQRELQEQEAEARQQLMLLEQQRNQSAHRLQNSLSSHQVRREHADSWLKGLRNERTDVDDQQPVTTSPSLTETPFAQGQWTGATPSPLLAQLPLGHVKPQLQVPIPPSEGASQPLWPVDSRERSTEKMDSALRPQQVIFSPDSTRDAEVQTMPLVPEAGMFDNAQLPTLWTEITRQQVTGRIDFELDGGSAQRSFYFEHGAAVLCRSSLGRDRFEDFLLRRGLLSREHYAMARAKDSSNSRALAVALLDEGLLKTRELFAAVREHLADNVLALFEWPKGHFKYLAERASEAERVSLPTNSLALVGDAIRRKYNLERLIAAVGGPSTLIAPVDSTLLGPFALSPEEQAVSAFLDGVRSLEDIILAAGVEEILAYRVALICIASGSHEIKARGLVLVEAEQALVRAHEQSIDRKRLFERLRQAREADYFSFLGLDRDVTSFAVQAAVEQVLDELETLRMRGFDEVDDRAAIGEIWQIAQDALQVLGDEHQRERYRHHLKDQVAR